MPSSNGCGDFFRFRSVAVHLGLALIATGAASAQAPLDAANPAITKQPQFLPKRSGVPEFPIASIKAKEEGVTSVRLCISSKGSVESADLAQSSGHARLDKATMEWAKEVIFEPAEANGKAVAVCNHVISHTWRYGGRN